MDGSTRLEQAALTAKMWHRGPKPYPAVILPPFSESGLKDSLMASHTLSDMWIDDSSADVIIKASPPRAFSRQIDPAVAAGAAARTRTKETIVTASKKLWPAATSCCRAVIHGERVCIGTHPRDGHGAAKLDAKQRRRRLLPDACLRTGLSQERGVAG